MDSSQVHSHHFTSLRLRLTVFEAFESASSGIRVLKHFGSFGELGDSKCSTERRFTPHTLFSFMVVSELRVSSLKRLNFGNDLLVFYLENSIVFHDFILPGILGGQT